MAQGANQVGQSQPVYQTDANGNTLTPTGNSAANPTYTANTAAPSTTAVPGSVPASTTPVNLLAADANRLGGSIYYDDAAILYLLEGTGTPSPTNFTTKLGAGLYTQYDVPNGYRGAIRGVWSAATGAAYTSSRSA